MSEMVERVARAMASKLSEQQLGSDPPWHDPEFRQNAIEVARAAIEAMREPTNEMICAADNLSSEISTADDRISVPASPEMTWPAMIDEALKTASV